MSGEYYNNKEESSLKENVLKDNLLFKDNCIKNASLLAKCNNPHIGIKYTTIEYENIFKELNDTSLGKLEKKTGRNNTEY